MSAQPGAGCRHVALFVFRDDATDEQIAAFGRGLAALPSRIPEIRDYRFGPDLGLNDGNHDYAVVADFASVEAYRAYRDHPAHQAVISDLLGPIVASRAAVQLRLEEISAGRTPDRTPPGDRRRL